jgi:hypothetical protein
MSRLTILTATGSGLLLAVVCWLAGRPNAEEAYRVSAVKPPEAAPLCPWREPEADLAKLLPGSTRYETETRVLSGVRQELAARLGREPSGDENALHLYRVYQEQSQLGTILTGRVKGEYGAIELVLAATTNQAVRGVRIQRCREPEITAQALQDPNWLRSFDGKFASSSWQLGTDIPAVPPEARVAAQSVIEGVRSLLVLLATAEQINSPRGSGEHHH